MPPSELHATVDRRLLWMSALTAALLLFLVNTSAALAGGDHGSHGWDSSDQGSSWQDGTEGTPPSWDHPSDQGQPPEGSGSEQPCEEGPPQEQPPAETPPVDTPPAETPPVDTPPEHTPPADTPPVDTPPVDTPPVDTPPVETPPVDTPPVETPPVTPPVETPPVTPPVETPSVTPPVETPPVETPPEETPPVETRDHPHSPPNTDTPAEQGGGVLAQEQGRAGQGGVVTASPAEATLPFTGSETPLLMLLGVAFLGVGLVLHRVSAARG